MKNKLQLQLKKPKLLKNQLQYHKQLQLKIKQPKRNKLSQNKQQ
jgi:hypothetical protein